MLRAKMRHLNSDAGTEIYEDERLCGIHRKRNTMDEDIQ